VRRVLSILKSVPLQLNSVPLERNPFRRDATRTAGTATRTAGTATRTAATATCTASTETRSAGTETRSAGTHLLTATTHDRSAGYCTANRRHVPPFPRLQFRTADRIIVPAALASAPEALAGVPLRLDVVSRQRAHSPRPSNASRPTAHWRPTMLATLASLARPPPLIRQPSPATQRIALEISSRTLGHRDGRARRPIALRVHFHITDRRKNACDHDKTPSFPRSCAPTASLRRTPTHSRVSSTSRARRRLDDGIASLTTHAFDQNVRERDTKRCPSPTHSRRPARPQRARVHSERQGHGR
jgi:hypothetical protein